MAVQELTQGVFWDSPQNLNAHLAVIIELADGDMKFILGALWQICDHEIASDQVSHKTEPAPEISTAGLRYLPKC